MDSLKIICLKSLLKHIGHQSDAMDKFKKLHKEKNKLELFLSFLYLSLTVPLLFFFKKLAISKKNSPIFSFLLSFIIVQYFVFRNFWHKRNTNIFICKRFSFNPNFSLFFSLIMFWPFGYLSIFIKFYSLYYKQYLFNIFTYTHTEENP